MKRKNCQVVNNNEISEKFIKKCKEEFNENPLNRITKNAITTIGSQLSTINHDRLKDINHLFMVSLKKKGVKATDQQRSGRCWMFGGLNVFRHILINGLNLEQFEFSETYLFFYDKLERSNIYIQWFIDNKDVDKNDNRYFEYMINDYMSDGGWYSTFSNLVEKYGLVPKSIYNETFQSEDTDDMNMILMEQLNRCVTKYMTKKLSLEEMYKEKTNTMKNIYNILVNFLGEPPTKFHWNFVIDQDENYTHTISDMNPMKFKNMIIPDINTRDFISLSNIPSRTIDKLYELELCKNIYEGFNERMLNVDIKEMEKYIIKSITGGIGVWIAADVSQKFNFYHSALDDVLDDGEIIFGKNTKENTKKENMILHNVSAKHAMVITGFNLDEKGNLKDLQCENSWGSFDSDVPGQDGFLWMSLSWFRKYVILMSVHKQFLSRRLLKLLEKEPEIIKPYDSLSKMSRVSGLKAPENYKEMLKKFNK